MTNCLWTQFLPTGISIPRAGMKGICEPQLRSWEQNAGPLEESSVLNL